MNGTWNIAAGRITCQWIARDCIRPCAGTATMVAKFAQPAFASSQITIAQRLEQGAVRINGCQRSVQHMPDTDTKKATWVHFSGVGYKDESIIVTERIARATDVQGRLNA